MREKVGGQIKRVIFLSFSDELLLILLGYCWQGVAAVEDIHSLNVVNFQFHNCNAKIVVVVFKKVPSHEGLDPIRTSQL